MIDRALAEAKKELSTLLCSLFIAIWQVVGYAFSKANAQNGFSPDWPSAPIALAATLVIWLLVFAACKLLFGWLDKHAETGWRTLASDGFFRKHCFVLSVLAIGICWLPYWFVYFPGSLPWDGVRSMNQFITDAPLENHHPVLMNAMYAGLMTIGRSLYSDNLGLLLVVAVQYAICVIVFALSVRQLAKMEAPRWLVILALVFYALHPVWGVFAQAAFKDTLFNAVFCFFVLSVLCLLLPKDGTRRSWALMLFASLALCFTRNNGVYLAIPTLTVLLVYFALGKACLGEGVRKRGRIGSLSVLLMVVLAHSVAFQVAYPALGINTKEEKEMLSVPFQQTARYLVEHPDDVTDEERAAIAAILPYDELASLYLPDLSDPVKESIYDSSGSMAPDEKSAYFSAWISMGLKHPDTYIRATAANIYAYFYPWVIIGQDIDRPVFPLYIQGEPINKSFNIHYMQSEELRTKTTEMLEAQLDLPIVKTLYSPALYIIAFLILLTYSIRSRNYTAWIVAVPFLMLLLTTLAGPLNGHLRYILPIAAALPIFIACAMRVSPSNDAERNSDC